MDEPWRTIIKIAVIIVLAGVLGLLAIPIPAWVVSQRTDKKLSRRQKALIGLCFFAAFCACLPLAFRGIAIGVAICRWLLYIVFMPYLAALLFGVAFLYLALFKIIVEAITYNKQEWILDVQKWQSDSENRSSTANQSADTPPPSVPESSEPA